MQPRRMQSKRLMRGMLLPPCTTGMAKARSESSTFATWSVRVPSTSEMLATIVDPSSILLAQSFILSRTPGSAALSFTPAMVSTMLSTMPATFPATPATSPILSAAFVTVSLTEPTALPTALPMLVIFSTISPRFGKASCWETLELLEMRPKAPISAVICTPGRLRSAFCRRSLRSAYGPLGCEGGGRGGGLWRPSSEMTKAGRGGGLGRPSSEMTKAGLLSTALVAPRASARRWSRHGPAAQSKRGIGIGNERVMGLSVAA
mmetsp:Transcript_26336/g.75592  ORF Transcript_26336/g.75592 Transcript_26336/m.75592 type:complete len:262 (-) Transcript_26336:7-792(-)